jgi:hypothetical protein
MADSGGIILSMYSRYHHIRLFAAHIQTPILFTLAWLS